MRHSQERLLPNDLLQQTSVLDPWLRLSLLHHCAELLRELTGPTAQDPPSRLPVDPEEIESPASDSDPKPVAVASESMLGLFEYGDEAALHAVRMEALEVFDTRPLDVHSYVVFWFDRVQVWGHPLLLCMGATEEGYRHILNFVEAPARDIACVQQLLCTLLDRGLRTDPGLFCITSGEAQLSRQVTECLQPVGMQYCHYRKRERVLSYLGDRDLARIKGAMMRAYEIPVYGPAHAALMQVHADLLHCNRGAVAPTGSGTNADVAAEWTHGRTQ